MVFYINHLSISCCVITDLFKVCYLTWDYLPITKVYMQYRFISQLTFLIIAKTNLRIWHFIQMPLFKLYCVSNFWWTSTCVQGNWVTGQKRLSYIYIYIYICVCVTCKGHGWNPWPQHTELTGKGKDLDNLDNAICELLELKYKYKYLKKFFTQFVNIVSLGSSGPVGYDINMKNS